MEAGRFWERGMEELLTTSTLFLQLLERMPDGSRSAVRAVAAGGITTIADLEFPMLDEGLEVELAGSILAAPETPFSTYCVPSSRQYLKTAGSHAAAQLAIQERAARMAGQKVNMFKDHVKVSPAVCWILGTCMSI